MSKILDELDYLASVVYEAKDQIDGYDTALPEHTPFTEVNRLYNETMVKLRELLDAIDMAIELIDAENEK